MEDMESFIHFIAKIYLVVCAVWMIAVIWLWHSADGAED